MKRILPIFYQRLDKMLSYIQRIFSNSNQNANIVAEPQMIHAHRRRRRRRRYINEPPFFREMDRDWQWDISANLSDEHIRHSIDNSIDNLKETSFNNLISILSNTPWNDLDFKLKIASLILERLYEDPEINPNQKFTVQPFNREVYLLELIAFDVDLCIKLIQHENIVINDINFLADNFTSLSEEGFKKIIDVLMVKCMPFPSFFDESKIELFNRFGFLNSSLEYHIGTVRKLIDSHIDKDVSENIRKCSSCLEHFKESEETFINAANCSCAMHKECALFFYKSFVATLQEKNPLDRKILNCPGCNGEILPSFLIAVKDYFMISLNILNFINEIGLENTIAYKSDLENMMLSNIDSLNESIIKLKFEHDPKFTLCPTKDCTGFRLIPQNEEYALKCYKCDQVKLFRGKNRRLESKKDSKKLNRMVRKYKAIRACPNCTKLIEKTEGCNHMVCYFCRSNFNWNDATKA